MTVFGERLVTKHTVAELLFDGYNDTLLEIAFKNNVSQLPYDKFGWFYSVSLKNSSMSI